MLLQMMLVLLCGWVIFHCIYTPYLPYPFLCWWTARLLPCPGYCKQCCNEHWGTCVSFNSGFLGVYAQQWDCWVVWQFYFQFLILDSSIQSFSHVWLFATPWTVTCQAFLSITNSQSPPKSMFIESGDTIQQSHPLSSPSPPALSLSQHQGLFK